MIRATVDWRWWLVLYLFLLGIYALFSYSLTAPNLILSNWSPYWQWQLWMWKTFFNDRRLLTYTFVGVISAVWLGYAWLLKALSRISLTTKQVIMVVLVACAPLMISNNALSYDVFNYIFNAKMVMVYQANPHIHVALDYYYDDWTRFMHNTNTPAPYGYGWTALSVIPFMIGQQKFLVTWLLFRGMSVLSLVGLAYLLSSFVSTKNRWWSYVVLLNPLLLIEVVSNSHNDLWMIVPALASMVLIFTKKPTISRSVASLILLGLSISIKFATVTLLPLWFIQVFFKPKALEKYWAYLASLALFLPLLTARSQQFHPWYLPWPFIWLPFITRRTWKWGLLLLSVSSLFRYVPYLWYGTYSPTELLQEKLITWVPWLIGLAVLGIYNWRAQAK